MADGSDCEVTQAGQNDINSQWSIFLTDLDELLSEYEQHRSTNDIAIVENLTIRLENAVRALQNSISLCITDMKAVLEMTRNFQLMFWDCYRWCEFRTRCSQVAVLSLSSPNSVDTRQVGRPKLRKRHWSSSVLWVLAGRTSLECYSSRAGLFTARLKSLALTTCPVFSDITDEQLDSKVGAFVNRSVQNADCRLQTGYKMQTRYKMQTADCRLGAKCRRV